MGCGIQPGVGASPTCLPAPGCTHCSALMYSLSTGLHSTLPTRTPSRTSSKRRPRFSPVMVSRVPPCRGPVSGESCGRQRLGHRQGPLALGGAVQRRQRVGKRPRLGPEGLPTLRIDLRASGRGKAHQPGRSELAAAAVGPARVRVPFPHPREPGARHSPALQQLQPAVPELLGEAGAAWGLLGTLCVRLSQLPSQP